MSDVADLPSSVRAAVYEFMRREVLLGTDSSDLTDTTPLITGGLLDSISVIKLVNYLENHFGVTFKAEEIKMSKLDSIDLITESLLDKLSA
jgi:acyl carrier protein